ncbi:MAG: choice-of-anchor N protein [Nitrospirae bacterium]|nr:choice-of-anchor N protein [Nitrospirota bacterium]
MRGITGLSTSILALILAATSATAVPTLQLNIEGATYYDSYVIDDGAGNTFTVNESWFTMDNPFVLDVVGADQPDAITNIQDVKLILSVQQQFWNPAGSVTINGLGDVSGTSATISAADFTLGMPEPFDDKTFPSHGVFPAYYYVLGLSPLLVDDPAQREPVYDYNAGYVPGVSTPSGFGDIQQYQVAYDGFFHVHFDLTGVAYGTGKWADGVSKFSPFSHDADGPPGPPIPEPSAALLFVTGLTVLLVAITRGKRHRAIRTGNRET